jgi:hypothetical protein
VLRGWFRVVDGQGEWGFPQVEIRRFGSNPSVELATDGTLDVEAFDPERNTLRARVELTTADGPTTGTVRVP